MCGICGEVRFDGAPVDPGRVLAMRDRLIHRGPDSDGLYVSEGGNMALAFRRLRIIDLTPNASQPMANEDGRVRVVFNGEIYNFRELRAGLAARGHRFRSQSDTETIVHLYEEKGADCIGDLDGMFAIAIWDERVRRLTLARDRAGKKPLFYHRSGRALVFASEMKAFFASADVPMDVDTAAIPYYLMFGYVPGPETFYKDVRQLEPGSVVTVDADGGWAARRYWRITFPRESEVAPIAEADAVAGVRERVTRAVERRLISDVPLGAFLSGGVDSTIVVGVMSRLTAERVKTFSIGFDGDAAYDETAYARIAAERFGTDHTEFRVSPSSVDLIDTLIWHHDGAFGDSSAVPTYVVSQLARSHVTVALTGDGGDEVFAGYRRFWAALQSERVPRAAAAALSALDAALPAPRHERSRRAEAARFLRARTLPFDERVTLWNSVFFTDLDALLRPELGRALGPIDRRHHLRAEEDGLTGRSPLSRLLHANFTSYLADDLLVKTDRCTMASSLEARSPFLDRDVIEYVAALPDHFKLRGRRGKAILRDAFADLLPQAINRRGKMGFGVPVSTWFRGHLREYMRALLLAPGARYREMLSGAFVEGLVSRHLSETANYGPQLWTLICFERWLQLLPEWKRGACPQSATPSAGPAVAASTP
jgi:asparagine synthase (glutamine-hydrolysing)